jgi:protein-tyrosine phosphatase
MPGFVDSHCHLVPGIDDGAGSFDEALEMAESLVSAGFAKIWCTPHRITGAYDADPAAIRELVVELQQRITRAGIPLLVAPASEYYFDEFLLPLLAHPLPLNETMVLVEFPPSTIATVVPEVLYKVIRSGYTPLIAHPERTKVFNPPDGPSPGSDFSLLSSLRAIVTGKKREKVERETRLSPLMAQLRSMGCRFQGNIGSFAGLYGDVARETALLFLREGIYDCLGSDAHRPSQLSTWLTEGLGVVQETVGSAGLKRLLRDKSRPSDAP